MAEAAALAAIKFVKAAAAYFGATLSTAQAAAIINTVTYTVASVGVNAYLSSQREFPNQGRALQLGIAPDLPRRWQVGERANAGILVDWHVSGNKNQFLWIVKYLHEGPSAPITKIIADGRTVYTGTLNHGDSVRLSEFDSPDERFRVHFFDGRVGQTAPSTLTSNGFVGATYRGTGCAYVIEQLHWDPDTTPAPPAMTYVSNGSHMYDRRLDGSQGGSGSHRLLDPATWAASKNPAVALDHYLLGNYWPTLSKPRMGVGLNYADVPYDRFAALANLCDELESSGVYGNQARYEANGFIEANQVHADIITELCKAMDARPADFGGQVSAISHDAKTAIMTITDDDLDEAGTEIYDPKRSWGRLLGGAQGNYQDPSNNYQPTEYPRVDDVAWEVEDGGETKTASLPLPFETNSTRAQRLARLFVNRERRQATLGGTYGPRVIELEEGDWFIRQGARFPSGKLFEVVEPPQLDPKTLSVTLAALEVDPTDSAWSTADEQTPNIPTGDTNNSPPALPVPVVTFSTFTYSFGQYSFSSVQFNHAEFSEAPLDIDIELTGSNGSGAPEANARITDVKIASGRQYGSFQGLLPGKSYVVRVRARAGTRASDWSAYTEFTAGLTAQYGAIGSTGATLGTDIYREDGITVVSDNDVVTPLGISAGFTGQGGLATLNNFSWGSGLLTGIPGELNDGRVSAGLNASGDLNRNIPTSRLNSSNVLRYTSGGQFIGDLNADLTLSNISAGFTGQGWGATAGQSAIDNDYAPQGVNALIDTDFLYGGTYWTDGVWGGTITGQTGGINLSSSWSGALNVLYRSGTGSQADGAIMEAGSSSGMAADYNLAARRKRLVSVGQGDRLFASALAAFHRMRECQLNIHYYNASGAYVGEFVVATGGRSGGAAFGAPENFDRLYGFATVPAGAYFASLRLRAVCNAGDTNPYSFWAQPMLAKVPALQIAPLPYAPGPPERIADITSQGISAGFVGQGGLATRNDITWGGTYISGFPGDTALLNANQLWSQVGGSGRPADNADVTGSNIAAGFTGQGALATLSQVGTAQIADGAVSNPEDDTLVSALSLNTTSTGWQDVCSALGIVVGSVAILTWDVEIVTSGFGQFTGYTLLIEWEVSRDGGATVIASGSESHGFGSAQFGGTSRFVGDEFDLTSGTEDYKFRVRFTWTSIGSGMSIHTRSASAGSNIKAIGFKK